jgi:hypothetical protein
VRVCVSRMEGRSVRSTERSEARNVATRSEAKGHALINKCFLLNLLLLGLNDFQVIIGLIVIIQKSDNI